MRTLTSLFHLGAAVLLSSASLNALAVPDNVYVRSIVNAGPGCPAGTVAGNISPDRQAFTLIYDQFAAEAGPGVPMSSSRTFCQINVDLHVPQGWSYTLFDVDYRGFAQLDPGTRGIQRSTYYFQGSSQQVTLQSTILGSYASDYQIHDQLGLEAVVWSPCGAERSLNIKAQVQVTAAHGRRAFMTIDSIDGNFRQIYGVRWRRC